MNNISKILLSDDEQQLVNNTAWILTKRIITDKVNLLLGQASIQQQQVIVKHAAWLPAAAVQSTPKIAKGENYLQLPYLLLDYPRCFNGDDVFAIRTMFWWGNFFSVTLHLSGNYKTIFQQKISANIFDVTQELFICINENQWQHHFEADNYVAVKKLPQAALQQMLEEKKFIKLAIKWPLQHWAAIPLLLDKAFDEIIAMLQP